MTRIHFILISFEEQGLVTETAILSLIQFHPFATKASLCLVYESSVLAFLSLHTNSVPDRVTEPNPFLVQDLVRKADVYSKL